MKPLTYTSSPAAMCSVLVACATLNACESEPQTTTPQRADEAHLWPLVDTTDDLQQDLQNPWLNGFAGASAVEMGLSGGSRDATGALPAGQTSASGEQSEGSRVERHDDTDAAQQDAAPSSPPDLFFVAYGEGKGSEKLLVVENRDESFWEGQCQISLHGNGSVDPWRSIELNLALAPGERWTLCTSTAQPGALLLGLSCDQTLAGSLYNGNDALVLRCGDTIIDSFGQVGVDPGSAWTGTARQAVSSADSTLARCSSVADVHPSDAFDVSDDWLTVLPVESLDEALERCATEGEMSHFGGARNG